jgi:general nucleoside transport system permease protein
MSAHTPVKLPAWMDYILQPLINLMLALVVSALVIVIIGQDPVEAVTLLLQGAFGNGESIGYTLYYATNIIFASLAVAVANHCGLFNIGGEGQAYIAGLGVALVCLYLDFLPAPVVIALAILASMLFGGAWAYIPGWLQAKRGSHIVITTIMFNFISYSVMTYLLVHVFIVPGSMAPESRTFIDSAILPDMKAVMGAFGIEIASSPLNLSFVWALICSVGVWLLIWHTRLGYTIRVAGANPTAAVYAGIRPERQIVVTMLISGALAGGIALNEVMGVQHRLLVGFTAGYGFTGIASALMGRNHPVGVLLASLLFGALYQGGAELAFNMPAISADMVVVIQGLIIVFTGALENLFRPALLRLAGRLSARASTGEA